MLKENNEQDIDKKNNSGKLLINTICLSIILYSWFLFKDKILNIIDSNNVNISDTYNDWYSISSYRETVISYLSQPDFSWTNFLKMISKTNAKLELYDWDEQMLYFSYPKNLFNDQIINNLTLNKKNVDYGKVEWSKTIFSSITIDNSENIYFRFPYNDFRIDWDEKIFIHFWNWLKYSMNLKELQDYLNGIQTYSNSNLYIPIWWNNVIWNHWAFVAKKGEPSLYRLSQDIIWEWWNMEQNIQKILDFVTNYIKYNNIDFLDWEEVLKKPDEVLMSKLADCSWKTILLASLLEQIWADYYLVYYDKHISTAVSGDFDLNNGYNFRYKWKIYYLAESTAKWYIIWKSILDRDLSLKKMEYIQKPWINSFVINVKTWKKITLN